jgi:hypothetical protein
MIDRLGMAPDGTFSPQRFVTAFGNIAPAARMNYSRVNSMRHWRTCLLFPSTFRIVSPGLAIRRRSPAASLVRPLLVAGYFMSRFHAHGPWLQLALPPRRYRGRRWCGRQLR